MLVGQQQSGIFEDWLYKTLMENGNLEVLAFFLNRDIRKRKVLSFIIIIFALEKAISCARRVFSLFLLKFNQAPLPYGWLVCNYSILEIITPSSY